MLFNLYVEMKLTTTRLPLVSYPWVFTVHLNVLIGGNKLNSIEFVPPVFVINTEPFRKSESIATKQIYFWNQIISKLHTPK